MKPTIGDIIEIKTRKGFAYAVFTHYKPKYGAVIRVFDRIFPSRPSDIQGIAHSPVQFITLFPLSAAVSQGIFEIIGNIELPDSLASFPIFRTGIRNPSTGHVESWSLWDGDRSIKVGKLKTDQYRLPLRGIWNDTILIERIDAGWRPETDAVDGIQSE